MDYLNMCLVDYEISTEAFAAFRTRQLQATRALLMDASPPHPAPLERGERETRSTGFLEDLYLVSQS